MPAGRDVTSPSAGPQATLAPTPVHASITSASPRPPPLSNLPDAMAVDLDDIAVPTYKGNFPRYKAELRIFLECFSCHGLLDGSLARPPDDASDDDKATFADKERILWQALHRGLGGTELTETLDACGDAVTDALQIWHKFVARKTHTTYGEHLARLERFHSSRFERGMNVYAWIAEQIELGEMLAFGGLKISDAEMADVLLIGSRDAYPGLASSLVSFNNAGEPMPRPKLVDVMNALDRAWRTDQSESERKSHYRSPRHGADDRATRTHTPRRQARDRLAEYERRQERTRREHHERTVL